jgi:hypothetical protein
LPEGEGEGEAAGDDLSGSDAGEFGSESEDEDLARDMMSEDVDLEAAFGRAVVASGQGGAPSEAGDDFGDQYLADALAELERGAEPELGADPEGEEEAEAEQGGGVGALLEAIETDKNGLIRCEIAPWQGRTLGRLTYFPPLQPPAKQIISLRCHMHANCSVIRRRARYGEEDLLRWLMSAQPVADAGSVEAAEAAARHRALALAMLPTEAPAKAASSSQACFFLWLGGYDCAHEDHWIDVVPCRRLQFCSLGSLYRCCDMARLVAWGRMCLLLTVHSACWMRW